MKILSTLFVFLLISLSLGCERAKEAQVEGAAPPSPLGIEAQPSKETETPSINVANVVLYPKEGDKVVLTVEVAQSPEEKRQGLQGRENLPDKHGMWFVFSEDVQEPFWMKDTPISLDILFVDQNFKIIDIIVKTTPNSELLLVPRQKYRYALELKSGSADTFKISVGDRVEFRLGPP